MNYLEELLKFECVKNSKFPAVKWSNKENYKTEIDTTSFNIGIPTGKLNKIIVLDVDIKDDGIKELNEYIRAYGNLETLTISTPSGGQHYYFKYRNSSTSARYLIENKLTNSTKYRNKGLDIRTNGGYVIGPPSKINNKEYIITNDIKPSEMPESLILWLMEGKDKDKEGTETDTKATKQPVKSSNALNIHYTKDELKDILDKLPSEYYEKFNEWLIVLTVLKNLNEYELFDNFSKKSKTKYDKANNLKIWNANKGAIDINYLILRINAEQGLNIPTFETYQPINNEFSPDDIPTLTINEKYLKYDYSTFTDNDTLIIKSITGTGKTTFTADICKRYLETNNNIKVLSIVDKISLSKQQMKTFKDKGLTLLNYQTANHYDLTHENAVICINSLMKLEEIEHFKNYIVFLDEVFSLMETITHNDTIYNIKDIYFLLVRILKQAHRVILSDAIINDNVKNLLKYRKRPNTIYIKNEFKKYDGVGAIRYNNEAEFIERLINNVMKNCYFLFGCDSCDIITKLYHLCYEKASKEQKEKFILITSKTEYEIMNATSQFKNKFVFYSPSITTGIDFSQSEAQDQFIYINGNSITPAGIFQQTTRTRNIKSVMYYVNCNAKASYFNSLKELETHYKDIIQTDEKISNICANINEEGDAVINEDMFFKMFCYHEYNLNCYNSNKKYHYETILLSQGFILSSTGEKLKLKPEVKKELRAEKKKREDAEYSNYKEQLKQLEEDTDKPPTINIFDSKTNKTFMNREEYLSVPLEELAKFNDDEKALYDALIKDEFTFNNYKNFLKLFKTNDNIEAKINGDNFKVKQLLSTYNKIHHLRQLEKTLKIKPLDLNFVVEGDITKLLTDAQYKIIKGLFQTSKPKPKTNTELKVLYVMMLKHIVGKLNFINSEREMKEGIRSRVYSLNEPLIRVYLKIASLNGCKFKNFDNSIIKAYGVQCVEKLKEPEYQTYTFKGK